MREFARWFEVHGVDLDRGLLDIAAHHLPPERLHQGDMRTFDFGVQVDIVTCLFSSIGYMATLSDMRVAVANMARHLKPGGVLLMEPWLYKDQYQSPHLHMLNVDEEDLKIARISQGVRRGDVSVIDFQYLVVTYDEVFRESERHELGLYDQSEYQQAIEDAGLACEYDPIGPMGRGLFLGVKA
jgi:SAM-dependent methyltransferase